MSLRNRVALVTGASRGIGREIALTLGRAGAAVAVAYHTNKLGAQKTVEELHRLGVGAMSVSTDVTEPARVKEMIEGVARQFSRLDILVNNVGDFEWKAVADSTVRDDALTILRTAAQAWASRGLGAVPPQAVWEQLWSVLEEGGVLRKKK